MVNNDLYFEEVQRLLKEGKEVCIRVKGNSMMPFIKNGDRVIVVAHLGTVLPLGSPILAQYEGKFVFHRYVGKKKWEICSCWRWQSGLERICICSAYLGDCDFTLP